jgi:hypothetical protein
LKLVLPRDGCRRQSFFKREEKDRFNFWGRFACSIPSDPFSEEPEEKEYLCSVWFLYLKKKKIGVLCDLVIYEMATKGEKSIAVVERVIRPQIM